MMDMCDAFPAKVYLKIACDDLQLGEFRRDNSPNCFAAVSLVNVQS